MFSLNTIYCAVTAVGFVIALYGLCSSSAHQKPDLRIYRPPQRK